MLAKVWEEIREWIPLIRDRRFLYFLLCLMLVVAYSGGPEQSVMNSAGFEINGYDEITFISYLHPTVSKTILNRYQIAITSWLSVHPQTQVILMMDPRYNVTDYLASYLEQFFDMSRIKFSQTVPTTIYGMPLVKNALEKGILLTRTRHFCFIGANVAVDAHWYAKVRSILNSMRERCVYITGKRVDIRTPDDFDTAKKPTLERLAKELTENVTCVDQSGNDYFVASMDQLPFTLSDFPELVLDGQFWDLHMNHIANSKAYAMSLDMTAPVYRLEIPRTDLWKERIYHNAKVVKRNGLKFLRVTELMGQSNDGLIFFSDIDVSVSDTKKPFIETPKCNGTDESIHNVKL